MHKRVIHFYQRKLRPYSGWYFVLAAVLFLSLAAFGLRQNNLRMLELRQAVFQADEAGEGIEEALRDLRQHVHGHMNTDLVSGENAIRPPIQLTHEYQRLRQAEQDRVADSNETVYQRAEELCESRHPSGQLEARAQCVETYITDNAVQSRPIPPELYQFDFVSPRWSPDLAGWSLAGGIFFSMLAAGRFLLDYWFFRRLRS